MLRKTSGLSLALSLALLTGCETGEEPAENVNTPSEGARIENQNPTTPTVDVPATPENEAAEAGSNVTAPGAVAPAEPGEPVPAGDNAGEKTLDNADAAVKTGGEDMPNP